MFSFWTLIVISLAAKNVFYLKISATKSVILIIGLASFFLQLLFKVMNNSAKAS